MPTIIQEIELLKRQIASLQSETAYSYINYFLSLPGLRGFWSMAAFDASGNAIDQSNNTRLLTYNGNPLYNYDNLAPYIDLDGTGDYLSRTDEGGLDITGIETVVATAVRGLTLGGWFWVDDASVTRPLITKFGSTLATRSYGLFVNSSDTMQLALADGVSLELYNGSTVTTGEWFFGVGRFDPGATGDLFFNGAKVSTVSTLASLANSSTEFRIGADVNVPTLTNGRMSMCFLCASYLSDQIISSLYQASRPLFRV